MENLKNKIKTTLKEFDSGKDVKKTEDKLKDTIDVVKRTLSVDDKEAKDVVQGMYSGEGHEDMNEAEGGDNSSKNYMFWQNLKTMKHSIEELLKMSQDDVDTLLENGHAWAVDHIATSSDDVEEVYHFIEANCEACSNKAKNMGDENIVENIKPKMTKGDLEKLIEKKK